MSITVKTNIAANGAINQLNKTSRALSRNFEKISSGLRVARAADDAAGLGVAENLKASHRSADVAARNVNDGISLISVAEGATNEVASILVRLRELAIQSASETLATTERSYIQDETDQLVSEIGRIAAVTEFNGVSLSDGSLSSIDVQVGIQNTANDVVSITLGDLTTATLGVGGLDLSTAAAASGAIDLIDTAIDSVSSIRSNYGAVENRLNNALNNLETYSEATKAAESRIRDADFGKETADLSQNQILQQAGVSILSQAKNLSSSAVTLLQG
jgi:flagellin